MINLIPKVKQITYSDGILENRFFRFNDSIDDARIVRALEKLPYSDDGAEIHIEIIEVAGDAYTLKIDRNAIFIKAQGPSGAFYAIQTLKQILTHDDIPCLTINDYPDFEYRGFYHDATRGKVPKVETIKALIDQMVYYKLNSLQIYVEHTFEFEEYRDVIDRTGYFTSEDIREIDRYCKENFVDFVPSLSTFGHLYELLEQEKYKHLRVAKDISSECNAWSSRMGHHTIDPRNNESIAVIRSLINQYLPCFESNKFNICGDETFDLKRLGDEGYDTGRLYVDFVKQIIDHVKNHAKTPMMWADILLAHPEVIGELPDDTVFLNWWYRECVDEQRIKVFHDLNRQQIVCPGTWTWTRLCEMVDREEKNISIMTEYGKKYGAKGVLNTNWGDWSNPCSLELAMYGMVLGAARSWSCDTTIDDEYYSSVDHLLYNGADGIEYLIEIDSLHNFVSYGRFLHNYTQHKYNESKDIRECVSIDISELHQKASDLLSRINADNSLPLNYKEEMISALEGLCVIAELDAAFNHITVNNIIDHRAWLGRFESLWLRKNKPSELYRIREVFDYYMTL